MKKTTLFLFFVCCILVACTCKKKNIFTKYSGAMGSE